MAIQAIAGDWGTGVARFGQLSRKWGVAVVAVAVLAACATPARVTEESPDDVKKAAVTERANARWQAVIESDAEKAYGFLSPGSKALTSFDAYKAKARLVGIRAAELESVTCEAEMCKMKFKVTFDHRLMKGLVLPVDETWVLENGQYWYVWRL